MSKSTLAVTLESRYEQPVGCVEIKDVIPDFRADGLLPEGVHLATDWREFVTRFGKTAHHKTLLKKFKLGLLNLRDAGCEWVLVDGSFVTNKPQPADVDGCRELTPNIDLIILDESFLLRAFKDRVALQADYSMDFFVAGATETGRGMPFSEFFHSTPGGIKKGIVKLELHTL